MSFLFSVFSEYIAVKMFFLNLIFLKNNNAAFFTVFLNIQKLHCLIIPVQIVQSDADRKQSKGRKQFEGFMIQARKDEVRRTGNSTST